MTWASSVISTTWNATATATQSELALRRGCKHALVAGVAGGAIGRGRAAIDGVVLVDGAVLQAGRDGVRVDGLCHLDTLVRHGLGARAVAQQVGTDRGIDRGHHVGVEGHGEVDGGGAVDGEVHVGGQVEDGDDLLVRQCRDALVGQLLR